MKSLLVMALMMVVGGIAQAGNLYDPNAVAVCKIMSMDAFKVRCMDQIKGNSYDRSVIRVCSAMNMDAFKQSCLDTIKNKRYTEDVEIQMCKSNSMDALKISCLAKATTRPLSSNSFDTNPTEQQDVSLDYIDREVGRAINALRNGNDRFAESILQDLRNDIRRSGRN